MDSDVENATLYCHAITHRSSVNGPGLRTVIHTQGCSLGCPGCFNPLTHAFEGGEAWRVEQLLLSIQQEQAEGVTLSGGEPTEQLPAVLALCQGLKAANVSVLLFSGRTLAEIQGMPLGEALLGCIDVLVDGRFRAEEKAEEGLRGSRNQTIHLLSRRHTPEELSLRAVEFFIQPNGQVRISGFPTPGLAQSVRRRLEV